MGIFCCIFSAHLLEVRRSKRFFCLQASTVATVCTMEASYQLAVNEEDLEKCLNYCRSVKPMVDKTLGDIWILDLPKY